MAVKDINMVVAENLTYWMNERGLKQPGLAVKAGVSQKTISNYVNPKQRTEGASGKQGSPKLYELDLIAKALEIEVWQLTRDMTPQQRAMYKAIEAAYSEFLASISPN